MRIFIVCDNGLDAQGILAASIKQNDEVILFPLTSSSAVASAMLTCAKQIGCSFSVLETALLVNRSAEQLRDKYLEFIADLGLDIRIDGKNLREHFAVDDTASMWWMSLVAEKNTFKSDAFNSLAQLDAAVAAAARYEVRSVYLAIDNPKLSSALAGYFQKNGISCRNLPVNRSASWRQRLKEHQGMYFLKHFLHLLAFAASYFVRARQIRQAFRDCARRLDDPQQLLLINAFPYFDLAAAQQGVFRNKQYAQLQAALEEKQKRIVWGLFFVQNEAVSFDEALAVAKKFIANGQNIYFIEEGCSPALQFRALVKLIVQSLKFLTVEKVVARRHHWRGYDFYPILKDAWYRSFLGPEGYQSLLFYGMFQELFKKIPAQKGVYCCEMQSWEKALISAKKKVHNPMPLMAYQHTTVSYMLLNYFTTPIELNTNGRYACPQPDKLICNGPLTYGYMQHSGWGLQSLAVAEAVRFDEFRRPAVLSAGGKKNVVLLALSISVEESVSLLNIVLDAFPPSSGVEVWVKPHPFVEFDRILQFMGLSRAQCPFVLKLDPIEILLAEARVVVVGESSVSLQAFRLECEIVLVNVPEWINMSPLKGFASAHIHTVNSSAELNLKVHEIFEAGPDRGRGAEAQALIDRFFCLNRDSDDPQKFLELLDVK